MNEKRNKKILFLQQIYSVYAKIKHINLQRFLKASPNSSAWYLERAYVKDYNLSRKIDINTDNTHPIVIQLQNNFGYLLDIAKRMYLKQPLNVTKIKQLGSRKSGKTFSDIEFFGILLILDNKNIHAYLICNMSKHLNDSWQELKQIIRATYPSINFIVRKTKKTIEFNDSKITCKYLHPQDNSNVKLTGLASNYLYDHVIIGSDERYEITENDYQYLKDAIRGANQLLEIESCNPWSILNEFIKKKHKFISSKWKTNY